MSWYDIAGSDGGHGNFRYCRSDTDENGERAGGSTSNVGRKTFASWVADNQLVTVRLAGSWPNLSWNNGTTEMAGHTFYWRWRGIETADPKFRAVDVEVRTEEKAPNPRATLRSYVSKN